MTPHGEAPARPERESQSAFMRGFIDDFTLTSMVLAIVSQSAFMRGFIDDFGSPDDRTALLASQSAFMRGFIDD